MSSVESAAVFAAVYSELVVNPAGGMAPNHTLELIYEKVGADQVDAYFEYACKRGEEHSKQRALDNPTIDAAELCRIIDYKRLSSGTVWKGLVDQLLEHINDTWPIGSDESYCYLYRLALYPYHLRPKPGMFKYSI